MVKGCLTPEGASPAIYHAKPVIIQGALIAANAQGDFEQFRPFLPQMEALDHYWETISKDITGAVRVPVSPPCIPTYSDPVRPSDGG
jgi:hypothetical protein